MVTEALAGSSRPNPRSTGTAGSCDGSASENGPGSVSIDLGHAWTRPGNAFTCDGMDVIIPGVQRLLAPARAKDIPVVYTTTAYAVTRADSDMGLWHLKIPVEVLAARDGCGRDRRADRTRARASR